jgi:hypothetical protein
VSSYVERTADDAVTVGALVAYLATLPDDWPVVVTFEGCLDPMSIGDFHRCRFVGGRPVIVFAYDQDMGSFFESIGDAESVS